MKKGTTRAGCIQKWLNFGMSDWLRSKRQIRHRFFVSNNQEPWTKNPEPPFERLFEQGLSSRSWKTCYSVYYKRSDTHFVRKYTGDLPRICFVSSGLAYTYTARSSVPCICGKLAGPFSQPALRRATKCVPRFTSVSRRKKHPLFLQGFSHMHKKTLQFRTFLCMPDSLLL